jgi:NADH-quinone oxidoreductase subunit N
MENLVSIKDIGLISPLIAIFLTSLVPITIKVMRGNKEQKAFTVLVEALLGLGVAISLIGFQASDNIVSAFMGSLLFDGGTKIVSIVLCILAGLSLFISTENINTRGKKLSEHVFLVLNSLAGMLIMIWANDLIVVFIGLEIMSLALYMLVALSHEPRYAKEAAFKYFILGSVASAIFLYGVALIFGPVGSTYFDHIIQFINTDYANNYVFLIGCFLCIAGMLFKVSIFPFHAWAPDVYQGAPTSVTAFMSTAVKMASFTVLLRIIGTGMLGEIGDIYGILEWLAVLSIVVGNLAAILQKNIKRLLAYSSIAHSGYLLIGVIVAGIGPQDNFGYSATLFYLLAYVAVSMGLLSLVSLLENTEESFVSIEDLKGLSRKKPILSVFIAILLLSLAGIPPLAGFFGKFFIFAAAIDLGLFWLAFWGVLGSLISIYYYLRPIVMMFMKEEEEGQEEVQMDFLSYLNIFIAVVFAIVIGLYSGESFELVNFASKF